MIFQNRLWRDGIGSGIRYQPIPEQWYRIPDTAHRYLDFLQPMPIPIPEKSHRYPDTDTRYRYRYQPLVIVSIKMIFLWSS